MKYEKYRQYSRQFPDLALWLDVPTCPTAVRFLGEAAGRDFCEHVAREYLETRVKYVRISKVVLKLWEIPFCPFISRTVGVSGGWSEDHQIIYYHIAGEPAFARAFSPALYTGGITLGKLSDVVRAIREQNPGQEIKADGCLIHHFERGWRSLSVGIFDQSDVKMCK